MSGEIPLGPVGSAGPTGPTGATGPTGPVGDATFYFFAQVASTLIAGTIGPTGFSNVVPGNFPAVGLSNLTIWAGGALAGNNTNFKVITIQFYDSAGALQATVVLDTTLTVQTAGHICTGSIGALASKMIALPSTIVANGGWSVTYTVSLGGAGVATPAMRLEVHP